MSSRATTQLLIHQACHESRHVTPAEAVCMLQAQVKHLPFRWHVKDEHLACGLCYTSGTTGNPKVRNFQLCEFIQPLHCLDQVACVVLLYISACYCMQNPKSLQLTETQVWQVNTAGTSPAEFCALSRALILFLACPLAYPNQVHGHTFRFIWSHTCRQPLHQRWKLNSLSPTTIGDGRTAPSSVSGAEVSVCIWPSEPKPHHV